MQSKTSFFNLTLLRKNVIRFSPLWIVYSAAWFVAMPLLLGMQLKNCCSASTPPAEAPMPMTSGEDGIPSECAEFC